MILVNSPDSYCGAKATRSSPSLLNWVGHFHSHPVVCRVSSTANFFFFGLVQWFILLESSRVSFIFEKWCYVNMLLAISFKNGFAIMTTMSDDHVKSGRRVLLEESTIPTGYKS